MKKAISILLTAILMLSVCLVPSTAQSFEENRVSVPYQEVKHGELAKYLDKESVGQFKKLYSEDPNSAYKFYSYLNDFQKEVYNAVANGAMPQEQITFNVTSDASVTGICETEDQANALIQALKDKLNRALLGGLSALIDDRPDMFWIGGFEASFVADGEDYPNGTSKVWIKQVNITLDVPNGYNNYNEVKTAYNNMMNVANSVEIQGNTRFEKVKFIHDWIAEKVVYDPNVGTVNEVPTAHYPTSVFLAPYTTVCEGYSEAFKILCDRAGIPTVIVISDTHEWNYVKMEDGNWYGMDVTWDDQGEDGTFYDFFLAGSETVPCYFNDANFAEGHPANGSHFVGVPPFNIYPKINTESYLPFMLEVDSTASVNKQKKTVYLLDGSKLQDSVFNLYGYELRTNADQSELYIYKNGVPVDTYKVIYKIDFVLGDVNLDGKITAIDARWTLQAISGSRTLSDAQKKAADVNEDGKVTAIDARWILQAISGSRVL